MATPGTTVSEAIYRMKVEGQAQLDAAARSVDGLAVSEERLTRQNTATERGFARLLSRLDPVVKAQMQYQQVLEQAARFEAAGIGTAQQHAQIIDLATRKYLDQVEAIQRATLAKQQYNQVPAGSSVNTAGAINARLGVRDDFGTAGRAADIAAYGAELDRLRAKYNPLFAAGQQYRATLQEINQALRIGAISERERATAIQATKTAFAAQVQAINAAGNAYTVAGRRAGAFGGSLGMLSFQINDIASGLLMGQSPFQIMAQQGGQVFQIWQMNNNVFRELRDLLVSVGRRIYAVIGPLGLAAAGFAAVAAAGAGLYSMLRKEGPTAETLLKEHNRLLGVIRESYDKVTNSASRWLEHSRDATLLQALQQEIDLRERLTQEIGKQIGSVTQKFLDPGGGSLFGYKVRSEYEAFSGALYKIAEGARQGQADVRAFIDEVSRIALAEPALRKAGAELINRFASGEQSAAAIARAVEQTMEIIALARGEKPTKRTRESLGLGGGSSDKEDAYERETKSLLKQIDTLRIQAEMIGLTERAAARYRAEQELLNAAREAGISLSAEERGRIANIAEQYASATEQLERMRRAQDQVNEINATLKDSFKGLISDFRSGLREGATAWEAFGKAGLNALDRLTDKLMDMAINNLWQAAFPGGGPIGVAGLAGVGRGGLFGGLIIPGILHRGGLAMNAPSSGRYIHPAYFDDAPRYHSGKPPFGPGEIPTILRGEEEVITPADPRHMWNRGKGGNQQAPTFVYAPQIDARNAAPGEAARLRAMIDEDRKSFERRMRHVVAGWHELDPGVLQG